MRAKYCVVITELKAVASVLWTTKTTLIMGRPGAMGNVPGNGMGKVENAPLDTKVKNLNRNSIVDPNQSLPCLCTRT